MKNRLTKSVEVVTEMQQQAERPPSQQSAPVPASPYSLPTTPFYSTGKNPWCM